jgi:hypothetical protein
MPAAHPALHFDAVRLASLDERVPAPTFIPLEPKIDAFSRRLTDCILPISRNRSKACIYP